MIYLKNTTQKQWVPIPIQRWNLFDLEEEEGETRDSGEIFHSTFDGKDIEVEYGGIVPGGMSVESDFGHYLLCGFKLPEGLPDGSYEFVLYINEPARLAGRESYVVQVGNYDYSPVKYEKIVEYEQYQETD